MIEGNRLTLEQVEEVVKQEREIGGRERDIKEVRGYYAASRKIDAWAAEQAPLSEQLIQKLHGLISQESARQSIKGAPLVVSVFRSGTEENVSNHSSVQVCYRDGQNVISDGRTREIVYMPPEAKDVPGLMAGFVRWCNEISSEDRLPCPLRAGIAHYQFVTIHPYYDGNGRTARLLTDLLLQEGDYGLSGTYSLAEYYAYNLGGYYEALAIGPSHNYYEGRADADLTPWLEYFCRGMAISCENALKRAQKMR